MCLSCVLHYIFISHVSNKQLITFTTSALCIYIVSLALSGEKNQLLQISRADEDSTKVNNQLLQKHCFSLHRKRFKRNL